MYCPLFMIVYTYFPSSSKIIAIFRWNTSDTSLMVSIFSYRFWMEASGSSHTPRFVTDLLCRVDAAVFRLNDAYLSICSTNCNLPSTRTELLAIKKHVYARQFLYKPVSTIIITCSCCDGKAYRKLLFEPRIMYVTVQFVTFYTWLRSNLPVLRHKISIQFLVLGRHQSQCGDALFLGGKGDLFFANREIRDTCIPGDQISHFTNYGG